MERTITTLSTYAKGSPFRMQLIYPLVTWVHISQLAFFFRDTDEQCRVYGGWREEEPTCYIELNVVGGLLESFLEPQHYPGRISVLGEARFFGRLALMV